MDQENKFLAPRFIGVPSGSRTRVPDVREQIAPRRQPRPVYYTREQLDELCEQIIGGFCMERYGQELTPIGNYGRTQSIRHRRATWGSRGELR